MQGSKNGVVKAGMGEFEFWKLSGVSNEYLLAELKGLVASGGRADARVVAHLAEVEERRLHLKAAASSLFDYCLRRLGFSESEAFHRITAARLARRFPVIFQLLEARSIHLSALRVLRDHLTLENHRELLTAASGKSKREVELLMAAFAPRPEVPTRIRKLPTPRAARPSPQICQARASLPDDAVPNAPAAGRTQSHPPAGLQPQLRECLHPQSAGRSWWSAPEGSPPDLTQSRGATEVDVGKEAESRGSGGDLVVALNGAGAQGIRCVEVGTSEVRSRSAAHGYRKGQGAPGTRAVEALSSARYLVRMSVGQGFKDKLERARDLMSHANPSGELEAVIERGLELLLQKLERQRFGWTGQSQAQKKARAARRAGHHETGRGSVPVGAALATLPRSPQRAELESKVPEAKMLRQPEDVKRAVPEAKMLRQPEDVKRRSREHIPNEIRRAVALRDGEQCTFVDETGRRCPSRAFLQLHHELAHALGGPSTLENLRLLCGSHNRLLAERDFGRAHQEHCLRRESRKSKAREAPGTNSTFERS
jgi:5-methylcytosine-specific restriction endonuclease McrA